MKPFRNGLAAGEWEFDEGSGDDAPWRLCGFAVVDFAGATAVVRYIDQNGREFESDDLPKP